MAAATGGGDGEARVMLQRHQPFAPMPGEYHHFGAPAAAADEMVEAVVLRTPVSSVRVVARAQIPGCCLQRVAGLPSNAKPRRRRFHDDLAS
jgi:hypothetical protein